MKQLLQRLEVYLQKKPYIEVNALLSTLKKDVQAYASSLNKEPDPVQQNDTQEELPLDVTN